MNIYQHTGNISDYIFPLVKAKKLEIERYEYIELIGTGFFIGDKGFALTAGHIVKQGFEDLKTDQVMLALFWSGSGWYVEEILEAEKHPDEDIGVILVPGDFWTSILQINDHPQNASCQYQCWGYPHAVAKEVQVLYQNVIEKPDLIYTEGYIRRRISRELYPTMIYIGEQFYELSEQGGGGYSGAPIILRSSTGKVKWEFIGVFLGEKESATVSYAVRAEAFANWTPAIITKTIKEESINI